MSTSPPLDSLGDCVICGIRTPTRCSECAANGTKWMYFCSREHQKLIYKTHKRVCGKLSKPLRWPTLNEKEAERYKLLSSLRTPYLGPEFDTFEKAFMSKVRWPYPINYISLVQFLQRPYDGALDDGKFLALALLRELGHAVRSVERGSRGVPQRNLEEERMFERIGTDCDPYELALNELDMTWSQIATTYRKSQWWEPLMHRCLIFFDLKAKAVDSKRKAAPSMELFEQMMYAMRETIKLLRGVVAKDHPREAENLAKQLREAVGLGSLPDMMKLVDPAIMRRYW